MKPLTISERNKKIEKLLPNVTIIDQFRTEKSTRCICECKVDRHTWECDWSNLSKGKGCPICGAKDGAKKRTIPIEEKQSIVRKLNPNILFIGHISGTTRYKCRCLIDNYEWNASWGSLLSGFGCPMCGNVNKIALEDAKKEFIDNGYIPKFDSIKSNKQKLLAETSDGYKVYLNVIEVRKGYDNKISIKNPYTLDNIKLWMKTNKCDDYEFVSDKFKGNHINHTWKCPEGHIFKMRWSNFYSGNRCPICNNSKGELKILKHLEYNSIKYIKEYKFKNCRDRRALPFDFYLPQYNMCIEYDGEMHYKETDLGNDLKLQQKHDKIKDDYCKVNNIFLLRIPYWELNNIENILRDNLRVL